MLNWFKDQAYGSDGALGYHQRAGVRREFVDSVDIGTPLARTDIWSPNNYLWALSSYDPNRRTWLNMNIFS